MAQRELAKNKQCQYKKLQDTVCTEMPVFRKLPEFRKFCTEGMYNYSMGKNKCSGYFLPISGFLCCTDWHLCK